MSTSTTTKRIAEFDPSTLPLAPDDLTEEQIWSVLEHVNTHPDGYMERFLVIKTKAGELVQLKLNRTQQDIMDVIKADIARGVPVRLAILKARQEGVSTFVQALFFSLTANNPRRNMWIITHEVEASANLFEMSEVFLDNLDERVTPKVRNRDKKRIRFDEPDPTVRRHKPGLRSRIYCEQAKKVEAGRSATIDYLHISERAFWPSRKTATSLLNAVPALPHTIVIQETTANGVRDAGGFYDLWTENYGKANAGWRCLFFPWFVHDEYIMPPEMFGELDEDGRLILVKDPDEEMREQDLRDGIEYVNVWGERELWKLTDAQIAWRRWSLREKCENDVYMFMQENPSNPQEAFLQSGRPWWDRKGLEEVRKTLCPPAAKGYFSCERYLRSAEPGQLWRSDHFHPKAIRLRQAEITWNDDEDGDWWIWRLPEEGHEYLVSADTAEGADTGDKAAIHIFDRHTLEQVAEFNGYIDTDLHAHQTAMACAIYNNATCIPEVNNTGYGFMVTFKGLWGRLYYRQDPDAPMNRSTSQWIQGFKTGPATRPILVTRGRNYIREKVPTIRSTRLYDEMVAFVKDSKGVPRATHGTHDDLVMAFLLILELAEWRPVRLAKEQREVTLLDDKSFQQHLARRRSGQYSQGVPRRKFRG